MNERIKALLLNARNMFDNGVTDSNNKIYIHGSEENLEKFAELIVQKCANLADEAEPYKAADLIKKHFRIEE